MKEDKIEYHPNGSINIKLNFTQMIENIMNVFMMKMEKHIVLLLLVNIGMIMELKV